MNQSTIIAAIVLAAILATSTVVMALPLESAEAIGETIGGDAIGGRGGDAESAARGGDAENTGDIEISDNDNNEGSIESLRNLAEGGASTLGNLAEGGASTSGAATGGEGGDATSTYNVDIDFS